jgi:MFS family permease
MLTSMPFGALSDRIGRRGVIVAGWGVYSLSYAGFACAATSFHIWMLFALYGLFYGLTEGVEKALLADIAPPEGRGRSFGWYNFAIGAGSLPASIIFGLIWQKAGAKAAFGLGASLACLAAVLLIVFIPTKTAEEKI